MMIRKDSQSKYPIMIHFIFLTHLTTTVMMTGIIWMVQVLNYPIYDFVCSSDFGAYHREHVQKVSWIVGPLMLAECFSAIYLYLNSPTEVLKSWFFLGLVLLAVIWVSTLVFQIPCHDKLSKRFSKQAHQRLVKTNWIRTLAWTVRMLLVLGLVYPWLSSFQSIP